LHKRSNACTASSKTGSTEWRVERSANSPIVSTIVAAVDSRRGAWPVEIQIEDVCSSSEEGELLMATYEEHQSSATRSAVMVSTVGLVPDATRPGGFCWLFVHESWLVPP